MPLFVTVAGLVSSGGTFLKRACVSSLTRGCMALTFTPSKEPDPIIYLRHTPPSCLLKYGAGICHYSLNLNHVVTFPISPLFPLYVTPASSIILFSAPSLPFFTYQWWRVCLMKWLMGVYY